MEHALLRSNSGAIDVGELAVCEGDEVHVTSLSAGQVRVGRQVGNRRRIREVMSRYAQHKKGFQVERLDQFHAEDEEWREILIEDRRAGPADVAAWRIDFTEWLRRLTTRLRRIALALAAGETTSAAAKMFGVSPARISQIRDLLRRSWEAYQGAPQIGAQPQPVAA
jgi:hypothetical protein